MAIKKRNPSKAEDMVMSSMGKAAQALTTSDFSDYLALSATVSLVALRDIQSDEFVKQYLETALNDLSAGSMPSVQIVRVDEVH